MSPLLTSENGPADSKKAKNQRSLMRGVSGCISRSVLQSFCSQQISKNEEETPALETLLKEGLQDRLFSVNIPKVYRSATL